MRTVQAMRYVTPLHEGGSLPAVVEADDGLLYVMKFVGAGQGPKALIAELVAGEIGRRIGLRVPEIVFMEMTPELGRSEPNPEIRDLLQASVGLNLGLRYLSGSLAFNTLLKPPLDAELASRIVWFDAFVTNVDRTPRNVNMLIWEGQLWLIDHGAALYFHYDWEGYLARSSTAFAMIKQHSLIALASALPAADAALRPQLTEAVFRAIASQIPDRWLDDEPQFRTADEQREGYVAYLTNRLAASSIFLEEAVHAHAQLV
ncbi:MAG: aminotransferase class I and II [Caldilineaceae bacterium]|nr:aminotransferase class I and II [Caldilineaceae bacterium]